MTQFHIAQVNIAHTKADLDDPLMAGFVARLDEINALAEQSPGFVWRFLTPEGNVSDLFLFDDDRILVNMSVWETVEQLRQYVYYSAHAQLLRQRHSWFERISGASMALWWVPAGHHPGMEEARRRLAHLEAHGPSPFAFTFQRQFPADASSFAPGPVST